MDAAHREIWDTVDTSFLKEIRMLGFLTVVSMIHDGIFEPFITFFVIIQFNCCRMDFPDNHSPTFLISYGEKTGQDRLGTRHKTIPYDLGILFSFIRGGQNGNLPIRMKNQQARFKLGNTFHD